MNAQVLDHVDTGADLQSAGAPVEPASPPSSTGSAPVVEQPVEQQPGGVVSTPPQRQDTVPHAALHEAREQVKALRGQIAALEAQPKLTAEDAELLKSLRQQRTAAAEPADPDFLADPKGYIDTKFTKALKKLEETDGKTTETRQQLEQQGQLQNLMNTVQAHERTFVTSTPDYPQALAHVRSVRTEQLKLLYPNATDAQIQGTISREEIAGAMQALQNNLNPAETLYKYAKTVGYASKAAPAQPAPDKSAARSLGSNGGASPAPDASETEDTMPEFTSALKERFGFTRKR